MKKLLALVLCVMLFVSIIPTAAFAATSDHSAVSLYPAVQQYKAVYNTLSYLFADKGIVSLYNGLVAAFPKFIKSADGALASLKGLYKAAADVDPETFYLTPELNMHISHAWDDIRQAFVGTYHEDVTAKSKYDDGTITAAIANQQAGVLASIPAAPWANN